MDDSGRAAGPGGEAPVVLLPGVMSDAHAWRRVAASIRAWPSVAVINRRGRSPSAPLPDGYSVETEIDDLAEVLEHIGARSVIAWSYGALIALRAGNRLDLDRLIAYEPVERPFAASSLPALGDAHAVEDWDRSVEIVNRDISGFDDAHIQALRSNERAWRALKELAHPLHPETVALNSVAPPAEYGARITRIDLIVGGDNLGKAPYGTSFADVAARIPCARTHVLSGNGHLAHLEDPAGLAHLIDAIAADGRGGRATSAPGA